MSHWHSVTRLQQTANGKLGASSPLLRFYKASRSPAATSTQRITQPRNNKRAGEGMSITAGPASHTAKTQRREKGFWYKIWKIHYPHIHIIKFMRAAAWFAVHIAVSANENYILQVAKSLVPTHNRTGPSQPPPSHPLSSAKTTPWPLHDEPYYWQASHHEPLWDNNPPAHQPCLCICLPINIPPES